MESDMSDSYTSDEGHSYSMSEGEAPPEDSAPVKAPPCDRCEKFYEMQQNGEFCDIKIEVNGRVVPAHRCVMVRCPYFRSLMYSDAGIKCPDVGVIEINLCSPEVFEKILKFLYTGEMPPHEDCQAAFEVLKCADMLLMEDLKSQCENYIIEAMAVKETFLSFGSALLEMTRELVLENLTRVLKRNTQQHFKSLSHTSGFLTLSESFLLELLQSEDVHTNELAILDATLRWVGHDRQNRDVALPAMLKLIRWGTMDKKEIVCKMQTEPALQTEESQRVLFEVLKVIAAPEICDSEMAHMLKHRMGSPRETIIVFPDILQFSQKGLAYFVQENRWIETHLSTPVLDVNFGLDVYNTQPANCIWKCNKLFQMIRQYWKNGKWDKTMVSKLESQRKAERYVTGIGPDIHVQRKAVVCGDHMYVVHGFTKKKDLNRNDLFDEVTGHMYDLDLSKEPEGNGLRTRKKIRLPYHCKPIEMLVHEAETASIFLLGVCYQVQGREHGMMIVLRYMLQTGTWSMTKALHDGEEKAYQFYIKDSQVHFKGIDIMTCVYLCHGRFYPHHLTPFLNLQIAVYCNFACIRRTFLH